MKLPPRQDIIWRAIYWLARIFAPDHFRDYTPLTKVERLAAYELRRFKPYANVTGMEHMAAYGTYRAGEIIRTANAAKNFDQHAARRARVPVAPLHRLPG